MSSVTANVSAAEAAVQSVRSTNAGITAIAPANPGHGCDMQILTQMERAVNAAITAAKEIVYSMDNDVQAYVDAARAFEANDTANQAAVLAGLNDNAGLATPQAGVLFYGTILSTQLGLSNPAITNSTGATVATISNSTEAPSETPAWETIQW